ncbi:MAG: murein biosynthesis integral membrane protein MurJ [Gaiellaceae bacterium]
MTDSNASGSPAQPVALPEQPAAPAGGRGTRLAWSTAVFSLATALSRLLGLVREIVVRALFGVSGSINAFEVAFLVPNTVRALVADAATSSAFVPVFSELLEKGERKRAWRVASSLFWLMLLGLGALTALFIVTAPWLMSPFGYHGHQARLVVGLSRVLFPIVMLLGVSGIVVGILNSYDHFSVPALTPVFWNLAILAGLGIGIPSVHTLDAKLYVYAVSILIGTIIQVLLPVPWLRGRDGRLRVVVDWRDPAVRRVFVLMVPVTLGLGLINFNAVVDSLVGARMIDKNLAPSTINAAFRLYILPQGIFSVAVATVLFPSLSRLATRGDADGFRETVSLGLRQIAFLLVPASVVCAVLAEPIVRLVYQRGAFHPAQTPIVAASLAAFAGGLTFNGTMLMLNRAFFSLQSNWVPTLVALANLGLNAALDVAFAGFGIWGIPLSTTLVNIAGTGALLLLLRRRIGRIDLGRVADSSLRILAASAVLAGVCFASWFGLDRALGRSELGQLGSVGIALVAGVAVYLGSARLLRVRELDALMSLRRRFRPA